MRMLEVCPPSHMYICRAGPGLLALKTSSVHFCLPASPSIEVACCIDNVQFVLIPTWRGRRGPPFSRHFRMARPSISTEEAKESEGRMRQGQMLSHHPTHNHHILRSTRCIGREALAKVLQRCGIRRIFRIFCVLQTLEKGRHILCCLSLSLNSAFRQLVRPCIRRTTSFDY